MVPCIEIYKLAILYKKKKKKKKKKVRFTCFKVSCYHWQWSFVHGSSWVFRPGCFAVLVGGLSNPIEP